MSKLIVTTLLASVLMGSLAFAQSEEEVVVGFPIALTGVASPYDDGPFKGAQLAIDDVNARGGLLGKKLVAVTSDTKTDAAQGATAATEVLGKGAKMVMVTCDFDFGAPAAVVAQSQNIIAFSSCAADPKFGKQGIGANAYTMGSASIAQGAILAEFAHKKGFKKAYVFKDSMIEYTKSLCDGFDARFVELEGEAAIVGRDTFHGVNDASIASQISRLIANAEKPDVIMFCGAINAASAVRQIRAAGIDTPMLAGDAMDGDYWLKSVPNLSNFYIATYGSVFGDDPNPAVNDFFKRFQAKFNSRAVTSHALTGYALIEAWAKAVERAGSFDTDMVRAELDKFNKEPLLIGPTTYTPDLHINVNRHMLILEITNAKYHAVENLAPEKTPDVTF